MNFSIHLPQPLLSDLDRYAKSRNTSRSHVVREAVATYLVNQTKSEWPADIRAWMEEALQPGFKPPPCDGPDFDAIRREANQDQEARSEAFLKEFAKELGE